MLSYLNLTSGHRLHRLLAIAFLILIKNVAHIGGYASPAAAHAESALSDTHRLAKRMDLESCLGQFDVHKNTIIRTGESQAIGGKYLQGLELDTMEECQRLCCETESCDVYIFEDKNDGYCYLFECGPPENFHCKFTRHANYTSSVLTSVRHVVEVTTPRPILPQIATTNISQQEWELTSLKVKPEMRDKPSEGLANGVNMATQVLQAELGFPLKASNTTAHCGRFQFTCHSGECIAVYNACDGIPQCEDGSDEGPECNGASSSSSILLPKSPNVETGSVNILEPSVEKVPSMNQYQPNLLQQTAQQQLQSVQQQQQLQQQQQQSQSALSPPMINNREDAAAWANRKIVSDTQQTDQSNSIDLNSRIFSHKGGLQLPTNGVGSFPNLNTNSQPNLSPMYAATLSRSGVYMPQDLQNNGIGGGLYAAPQQQIITPQGRVVIPSNVNWQQQQSVATAISPGTGVQLPTGQAYMTINTAAQQPQIPQAINEGVIMQAPPSIPVAVAPQSPAENQTNKESVKKTLEPETAGADGDEYEDYEEKSTEPPKKKQRKHKKVKTSKTSESTQKQAKPKDPIAIELALEQQKQEATGGGVVQPAPASPVHEQYKMIHDNLAMEFRDHDGQSERPGGAVLSLTLGLLVTAALAILIGCRMRVGRRTRRLGGKTPYSHEADFLVNGMYL